MTNTTHTAILILLITAGLAGWNGADAPSPTAPSVRLQQAPLPTGGGRDTYNVADVTLSGMVYEVTPMGRVAVQGVRVQSDYFHVHPTPDVVTDSRGFFSFKPVWVCPCSWASWVDAGITAIRVEKDGYKVVPGQPASIFGRRLEADAVPDDALRDVTINGDTRFDIELVRR